MSLYKKEDIRRIFDKEKILVGSNDVFPEYRAIEIFGENAVDFSKRLGVRGSNGSLYGIGDYQFKYLTLAGVEVAATYKNICNIRQMIASEGGVAV